MAQVAKLPVIDISDPSQDEAQVAQELVEAAIEHGFLYIKNTGRDIPIDAVGGVFDLVNEHWETPLMGASASLTQVSPDLLPIP